MAACDASVGGITMFAFDALHCYVSVCVAPAIAAASTSDLERLASTRLKVWLLSFLLLLQVKDVILTALGVLEDKLRVLQHAVEESKHPIKQEEPDNVYMNGY